MLVDAIHEKSHSQIDGKDSFKPTILPNLENVRMSFSTSPANGTTSNLFTYPILIKTDPKHVTVSREAELIPITHRKHQGIIVIKSSYAFLINVDPFNRTEQR
ncbi:hypothetical protein J0K78_03540 [Halobacillus sp. GSS1]|uniref:hypothetical protein n=1 Tax=Halobacillus sp. GSS1 TaxID=2815919 RepID=UPI001A8DF40F|nr:hypothetical protein [Halobacillus sp. GSS1]MBN9653328.1 hypothetical protein [Halobacillus sp. GSS1]